MPPVSAATNLGTGRRVLDHFLPKRGESHLSKGEQMSLGINRPEYSALSHVTVVGLTLNLSSKDKSFLFFLIEFIGVTLVNKII